MSTPLYKTKKERQFHHHVFSVTPAVASQKNLIHSRAFFLTARSKAYQDGAAVHTTCTSKHHHQLTLHASHHASIIMHQIRVRGFSKWPLKNCKANFLGMKLAFFLNLEGFYLQKSPDVLALKPSSFHLFCNGCWGLSLRVGQCTITKRVRGRKHCLKTHKGIVNLTEDNIGHDSIRWISACPTPRIHLVTKDQYEHTLSHLQIINSQTTKFFEPAAKIKSLDSIPLSSAKQARQAAVKTGTFACNCQRQKPPSKLCPVITPIHYIH